ncbi:MAG: anti-sigma factor family protein [Oscillospiraceae bacterium]
MKDCEYYREKISCLIDGELSPDETAELEIHIAECSECRALYDAFTAVSAAVSGGMEEPPEHIAPAVMQEVRAIAGRKKRGVWIKCLSAAACLALVVLVGAKAGLFGGTSYSGADSAGEVTDMAVGTLAGSEAYAGDAAGEDAAGEDAADEKRSEADSTNGMIAEPLDIDAKAAYFTSVYGDTYCVEDSDGLEKLKALMAPMPDVKRVPQGEPNYNLSFDCGEEFIVMELYIEDDVVFADSGDGPCVVAGSPDEIMAFIK